MNYILPQFPTYMVKRQIVPPKLFYLLHILQNLEVRGFYLIFNKPVNGQRTSSNANIARSAVHILVAHKLATFRDKVGYIYEKNLLLAEYVNLFWQCQWIHEWWSCYKAFKRIPIYLKKYNPIDIISSTNFFIYNFYKNPFKLNKFKKIKHRKKKTIPKNKLAVGFPFGFSVVYNYRL